MRIKKNKSSWRATAVTTRDARHDRSFDGPTGRKKKKNKRRWCKGIEGREHRIDLVPWKHFSERALVQKCKNCGKEFDVIWKCRSCGERLDRKSRPHEVSLFSHGGRCCRCYGAETGQTCNK